MYHLYHTVLNLLFGFIPLVPMMMVFHFVMLRKDGRRKKTALSHRMAAYLFCFAVLGIFSATGIPGLRDFHVGAAINFDNMVPLIHIRTDTRQYVLNVVLFIPIGFLLPMLWKRFQKIYATFTFGALFSLFIEAMQIFSPRFTDIDDLLMNTAGAVVGYCLFMLVKWRAPKISRLSIKASDHWKWEPYACFFFVWCSVFFIQQSLTLRLLGMIIR